MHLQMQTNAKTCSLTFFFNVLSIGSLSVKSLRCVVLVMVSTFFREFNLSVLANLSLALPLPCFSLSIFISIKSLVF